MRRNKYKNNRRYNNNFNKTNTHDKMSTYISSPGIVITNPVQYIPAYEQSHSNITLFKMGGEAPFADGSITNVKVNLYNSKDLDATTAQVRVIPLQNTEFNIRGVSVTQNGTQYSLNRAAKLANNNAQIVRQTLLAKQQYNLDFLTLYSAENMTTNPLDPIFILGLASNYHGVVASQLFARIFRTAAYIGEAVNYDKEKANLYMDFQAVLQRRSLTSAIGTFIGAFKSLIVDHETVTSYLQLSNMEKNSNGYNTPFIYHDYSFTNNPTLNVLKVVKEVNNKPVTINLFDKTYWTNCWKSFFRFEHIDALLNNSPNTNLPDLTDPTGKIIPWNTVTIRSYADLMRQYLESMTDTIRTTVTIFTPYYAALTIISETGVLTDSFKPNYDLAVIVPWLSRIHNDFKLASLTNIVSTYRKLSPKIDDTTNTVTITLPYYKNFQPFPGTDGNELLKYITLNNGDYAAFTDLNSTELGHETKDGVRVITLWAKTPAASTDNFFYEGAWNNRTAVNIKNISQVWTIGRKSGENVLGVNYIPYIVKSFANYLAEYAVIAMNFGQTRAIWTLYVDGYMNMSYLSIAPSVLNSASYSIGLKNANTLF